MGFVVVRWRSQVCDAVQCCIPAVKSLCAAHADLNFWDALRCWRWKCPKMSSLQGKAKANTIRLSYRYHQIILCTLDIVLLRTTDHLPCVQLRPSSKSKPRAHWQLKEPPVFTHTDPWGHGLFTHSSTSTEKHSLNQSLFIFVTNPHENKHY